MQTKLSKSGVTELFSRLEAYDGPPLPLRIIYLNAVGTARSACEAISTYLSSESCTSESLYLSRNPLGDDSAAALDPVLYSNTSLLRLTLASCGINDEGGQSILLCLANHTRLMTLVLSQNYATKDLGMRYIYLEDGLLGELKRFVANGPKTLRMLDLGIIAMSLPALWSVAE